MAISRSIVLLQLAGSTCSHSLREPPSASQAVDASDGLRVSLRIHSTGQYETIASGCFCGHAGSKTMVAHDLKRWLERNEHFAQEVTQRQRSPNRHDSRRR
jgi:hypothetical protein